MYVLSARGSSSDVVSVISSEWVREWRVWLVAGWKPACRSGSTGAAAARR
eukprot:COSAG06_NODE_63468_length_262_cov_0.638037_1_plen_49_part_10